MYDAFHSIVLLKPWIERCVDGMRIDGKRAVRIHRSHTDMEDGHRRFKKCPKIRAYLNFAGTHCDLHTEAK